MTRFLAARISVLLLVILALLVLCSCGGSGGSTIAPAQPAPTAVSVEGSSSQATISWSAVAGASSYNIYWSTTSDVSPAAGTKIAGVTSPFTMTGLTSGTPYYFVVCAVNGGTESAPSTPVRFQSSKIIFLSRVSGGVFEVNASGITGMAGVDLTIRYDTALMANPRTVQGSLATGGMMVVNPNIPGQLQLALIKTSAMSGSGTLATISFDQLGDSPGTLGISGSAIDVQGRKLSVIFLGWADLASHTGTDGGAVAIPAPVAVPVSGPGTVSVPAQF